MKFNFEINDNVATIKINKEIYPKEVIIQTTYVMIEDFYFLIDLKENYFIVEMKRKGEDKILQEDVFKFFDELIESQSYLDQLKRTSEIRQIILERALLTQNLE